jgi:hypothetical protein
MRKPFLDRPTLTSLTNRTHFALALKLADFLNDQSFSFCLHVPPVGLSVCPYADSYTTVPISVSAAVYR